jgi:general secretion pathway protein I
MNTVSARRQIGFSLLEILVAFSILALSLGILMRILSGSLNNADVAQDRFHAALVANSIMAGAGTDYGLTPAERNGIHGDRFRWNLKIMPFVADDVPPATLKQQSTSLWQITVTVEWGNSLGTLPYNLTLSSLRLGRGSEQ